MNCKWQFLAIKQGRLIYKTECGAKAMRQKNYQYCPYCGCSIELNREPHSNKVARGQMQENNKIEK